MIRSLTRKVLGSAAAAVDLMATAAVTAHAQRTGQARVRPHADRLRALAGKVHDPGYPPVPNEENISSLATPGYGGSCTLRDEREPDAAE